MEGRYLQEKFQYPGFLCRAALIGAGRAIGDRCIYEVLSSFGDSGVLRSSTHDSDVYLSILLFVWTDLRGRPKRHANPRRRASSKRAWRQRMSPAVRVARPRAVQLDPRPVTVPRGRHREPVRLDFCPAALAEADLPILMAVCPRGGGRPPDAPICLVFKHKFCLTGQNGEQMRTDRHQARLKGHGAAGGPGTGWQRLNDLLGDDS